MADDIAKGDLFLNTFQTKQQKVAFIQADESETNCADKLETLGIGSDITFYFSATFKKLTVDELTIIKHHHKQQLQLLKEGF